VINGRHSVCNYELIATYSALLSTMDCSGCPAPAARRTTILNDGMPRRNRNVTNSVRQCVGIPLLPMRLLVRRPGSRASAHRIDRENVIIDGARLSKLLVGHRSLRYIRNLRYTRVAGARLGIRQGATNACDEIETNIGHLRSGGRHGEVAVSRRSKCHHHLHGTLADGGHRKIG
jgi:hypothetical protein